MRCTCTPYFSHHDWQSVPCSEDVKHTSPSQRWVLTNTIVTDEGLLENNIGNGRNSHYHQCGALNKNLNRVSQVNVSCETRYVENSAKHTLHNARNIPQCLFFLYPLELCQLKPGVPPDQREHRPHNRSIQSHEQGQEAPQLHHCERLRYAASRCTKHIPGCGTQSIEDECERERPFPDRTGGELT